MEVKLSLSSEVSDLVKNRLPDVFGNHKKVLNISRVHSGNAVLTYSAWSGSSYGEPAYMKNFNIYIFCSISDSKDGCCINFSLV